MNVSILSSMRFMFETLIILYGTWESFFLIILWNFFYFHSTNIMIIIFSCICIRNILEWFLKRARKLISVMLEIHQNNVDMFFVRINKVETEVHRRFHEKNDNCDVINNWYGTVRIFLSRRLSIISFPHL